MELLAKRFATGEDSTIAAIYVYQGSGLSFRCFALEDQPNSPKVPGETRIPPGRYKIELRTEGGMHPRYKERFGFHKGMLWLKDVPDFTFVYIHVGNDDDETEGCLLVGDGATQNVTEEGRVTSSVAAYSRLYPEIIDAMEGGEEAWITIEDFA